MFDAITTVTDTQGMWLLFAICILAFGVIARRFMTRRTGPSWRRLCMEEDGAAYTLSYVMIIPLYALIMCVLIEIPLMMSAKLGTVYAGFAAARSVAVWNSASDWNRTKQRAELAALKAFIPFSSGTQSLISGGVPSQQQRPMLLDFGKSYLAFAALNDGEAAPQYLLKKISYATKHLSITLDPPATWESDIAVNVTYDFPFNVPGVGRIFGQRTLDGRYVYRLTSTVILSNESPQNDEQSLGIGYGRIEP